jgi:transcriptional regulator with XRE-family HTH domain
MTVPGQAAEPFPFLELGIEDIPHLGHFAAQLRISRGITNAQQLAKALNISSSVITRFEQGHFKNTVYFERLIEALAQDRIGSIEVKSPLATHEIQLLREIDRENRTPTRRETLHKILKEIEFEHLLHADGPFPKPKSPSKKLRTAPRYADIVGHLKQQSNPAFVADELWHIHAINGAAFRLFGVNPEARAGLEYLHRWEAWHVMAAKFTEPSPVRSSMVEINRYFPPTVDAFFQDVCCYLFTPQVRVLLSALHRMSKQNQLGFGRMWNSAATLTSFLKQEDALYRAIVYKGRKIEAIARQRWEWIVYPSSNTTRPVLYWMGVWEPNDAAAKEAFAEIREQPNSSTIYYAATYEREARQRNDQVRRFHVNHWPELASLL